MNEQQFNRRVARLNANVLQLCFSQSTDLNLLQPPQTLQNILQLLDPGVSDLGRFVTFISYFEMEEWIVAFCFIEFFVFFSLEMDL